MRHDILQSKKSVHIMLEKEMHSQLRQKLIATGLTMQDLFLEAAETALRNDVKSEKLLSKISKKKLERALSKKNSNLLCEMDKETLYNIIDDDGKQSNDARDKDDEG